MPKDIVIKPMCMKELRVLCDCTHYQLREQLKKTAERYKKEFKDFDFDRTGKKMLTKPQVKIFLQHSDMLPEIYTIG